MPIAAIALDFDPILRLGDVTVRWQMVALAAVVVVVLVVAAGFGRRVGLRADDLLFVAVGVVPGSVIGGRLGYVLGHLEFYQANPEAIVDPAQGSLTLGLAVGGGMLTGAIVARLLGTPARLWFHVAAVPLLVGIGLGKLAMVLSGSGQGMPSGEAWATAYLGEGPWSSLAPEIPSHPSQVYEAAVVLGTLLILAILAAARAFRARDGRALFAAVLLWSLGRAAVGSVWREPPVLGIFRVEQLVALGLAMVSLVGIVLLARRGHAPAAREGDAPLDSPEWPDPAARPRF